MPEPAEPTAEPSWDAADLSGAGRFDVGNRFGDCCWPVEDDLFVPPEVPPVGTPGRFSPGRSARDRLSVSGCAFPVGVQSPASRKPAHAADLPSADAVAVSVSRSAPFGRVAFMLDTSELAGLPASALSRALAPRLAACGPVLFVAVTELSGTGTLLPAIVTEPAVAVAVEL